MLLELSESSHEIDVAERLANAAIGELGATGERDPRYQHQSGSAPEVLAAWRRMDEQFDTQVDMLLAEFMRGHSL
jgi:hypothetical protein